MKNLVKKGRGRSIEVISSEPFLVPSDQTLVDAMDLYRSCKNLSTEARLLYSEGIVIAEMCEADTEERYIGAYLMNLTYPKRLSAYQLHNQLRSAHFSPLVYSRDEINEFYDYPIKFSYDFSKEFYKEFSQNLFYRLSSDRVNRLEELRLLFIISKYKVLL